MTQIAHDEGPRNGLPGYSYEEIMLRDKVYAGLFEAHVAGRVLGLEVLILSEIVGGDAWQVVGVTGAPR
eukprot:7695864-Prorocentrum_lima.AAC.1